MGKANHTGNMKRRESRQNSHKFKLGNYIIFTDTEKTEKNYFEGLSKSIPSDMQDNIKIKVFHSKTMDLVEECKNRASLEPQYSEPWIVLDRDLVPKFDELIEIAAKEGIKVGWSNPCIEIWFEAYFGSMRPYLNSASCCTGFAATYERKTGQEYNKASENIYANLCRYGDQEKAFSVADNKLKFAEDAGYIKPSVKCPATTIHFLVREIINKTK